MLLDADVQIKHGKTGLKSKTVLYTLLSDLYIKFLTLFGGNSMAADGMKERSTVNDLCRCSLYFTFCCH